MTRLLFLASLSLIVISIASCGENTAPIIDKVIVPEAIEPGSTVKFQVIAHDVDEDPLTYIWIVNDVPLDGTDGVVLWKSPQADTDVTVEVHVSDGVNEDVVRRVKVKVGKGTPDPREEFISFLDGLGLVADSDFSVGTRTWTFDKNGFVIFSSVEARAGNNWLVLVFGGTYTLKSNSKGGYTASCHFIRKSSLLFPGGEIVAETKHDERITVSLKRSGNTLFINDIPYQKL